MNKFKRGSALLTVMVLTGVMALIIGSTMTYVYTTSRMTAMAIGRDVCRLAAQSEIELAKSAINFQFQNSLNRTAVMLGTTIGGNPFDKWFKPFSGATAKRTIGEVIGSKDATVTFAETVTRNGCTVKVRIGRVDHTQGRQNADVTIVAEATRTNPGGGVSKVVIAEKVRFAQQRSAVFNNAYFVNNYGWFKGGGVIANGDVRSNADLYIDSECVVNGRLYAAKNEELGVDGDFISDGDGAPDMMSRSEYLNAQFSSYGKNAVRPLYRNPTTGEVNPGGYDAPNRDPTTKDRNDRLHANGAFPLEMPYIGDLTSESCEYRQWIQEIQAIDPGMCKIKKGGKTLVDGYYYGKGPSGEETVTLANGKTVTAPDYGAMVLIGTDANPIEINGPVIIPSDVIIKGVVKGQGTIYSGRNIHIIGNLTYKNPPNWSGRTTQSSNNSTKDMLGLMAKGNIIIGDYGGTYTKQVVTGYDRRGRAQYANVQVSFADYIGESMYDSEYIKPYGCDPTDAAIGYPNVFGNNNSKTKYYQDDEYVPSSQVAASGVSFIPGGYNQSTGKFGKLTKRVVQEKYITGYDRNGNPKYGYRDKTVYDCSYNRKYYESVCNYDEVIKGKTETIYQIDGILYNNHGIFGTFGKNAAVNGSFVCRNEGTIYDTHIYFNWDSRLYSGATDAVDNDIVGLAKASDAPPETLSWMELPEGVVSFGAEDSTGD